MTGHTRSRWSGDQRRWQHRVVPERVMFVQLKTGYGLDKGPAWISVVLDSADDIDHQTLVSVLDAAGGAQIEKVHFVSRAGPAKAGGEEE